MHMIRKEYFVYKIVPVFEHEIVHYSLKTD
jgi:hypothetical protein